MKKTGLTIVIPVYNEEKSIEATLAEVNSKVKGAEILAVNDGSKDHSLDILNEQKKHYSNLSVISHPKNRGYGAALKTGFAGAKKEYVAFLDADLTYPPEHIPKLLEKLKEENLDFAWGNRFGGKANSMPLIRKVGNRMLIILTLLITGRRVTDCASGERVFRKDALSRINYGTLPDGLDFITALTKRILSRKLKFATMPINYRGREGASKLNVVKDFLKMCRNIIFEK